MLLLLDRIGGLFRANYCFVANIDREIRRDLERDIGYGITNSWDEIVEAMQGTPVVTDVTELSQRMTEDDRLLARSAQLLFRDRRAHARTAGLKRLWLGCLENAWGRGSLLGCEIIRWQKSSQRHLLKLYLKRLHDSDDRVREDIRDHQSTAQPELREGLVAVSRLCYG
ncbi:hypothetical protein Tco_0866743 [Tanacetum coccineum]